MTGTEQGGYVEYFDYLFEGEDYRCSYFVSEGKLFLSVGNLKVGAALERMLPARLARILAHELLVQRSFANRPCTDDRAA